MSDNEQTGLCVGADGDKYKSYSEADACEVIRICEEQGWDIIPYDSEYYPQLLLTTEDYPLVLFCDGQKELLNRSAPIAIVGSREPEKRAAEIAYNSAYNLVKTGSLIVSGAARGIDSAAHLGAIEGGGYTVGVLGCGLGNSYMNRVKNLYERVLPQGAYITEFFPYEKVSFFSFQDRNRIISGMSRAVLVACASEKSGALITANHAKKQKRRIYSMAPEICFSKGCENLIKDGTAYAFYHAGDIAYPLREYYDEEAFNEYYCNRPVSPPSDNEERIDMSLIEGKGRKTTRKKSNTKKDKAEEQKQKQEKKQEQEQEQEQKQNEIPEDMSDNARLIYGMLTDGVFSVDSFVESTGLRIPLVLCAVSELETLRLIKTLPGGRIEKIK